MQLIEDNVERLPELPQVVNKSSFTGRQLVGVHAVW